jgi:hypothetical protein
LVLVQPSHFLHPLAAIHPPVVQLTVGQGLQSHLLHPLESTTNPVLHDNPAQSTTGQTVLQSQLLHPAALTAYPLGQVLLQLVTLVQGLHSQVLQLVVGSTLYPY